MNQFIGHQWFDFHGHYGDAKLSRPSPRPGGGGAPALRTAVAHPGGPRGPVSGRQPQRQQRQQYAERSGPSRGAEVQRPPPHQYANPADVLAGLPLTLVPHLGPKGQRRLLKVWPLVGPKIQKKC
jgi:hypothetical protein